MAIYIQPEACRPDSGSWLWTTTGDERILEEALANADKVDDRYYCRASPWDCTGDLMVHGILEKKRCEQALGRDWKNTLCIEMHNSSEFYSEFYRAEDLLRFYAKLKSCGWNIILRNKEDNMDSIFKMECPSFEEFVSENCKEQGLLPVKGAIVAANAVLSGSPEKQAREYSHPVDAALVKVLDNPAINTVFKSFVDMTVDAQFGTVIASGIPVNATTFPVLNDIVEHCVSVLRIRRPYVIVSGSLGFNAMTLGSDEYPYILLGNLLTKAMSEDQLRFAIGHECGHIAMGHVVYHTAVSTAGGVANALPVVGPVIYNTAGLAIKAWSRRSEITADRAGLLCCGSLDLAKKTLMQLEMGFMNTDNLDVDNYVQNSQNYRKGGILRKVGEYTAEHPILPKRIQALDAFADSELFYHVTNQIAPVGAMSDQKLAQTVEDLIRVL